MEGLSPGDKPTFAAKSVMRVRWSKLKLCVVMSGKGSRMSVTESSAIARDKFASVRSMGTEEEQVLRKTETLFEDELATAMSGLPSPLKSPVADPHGVVPAVREGVVLNLPPPSPKRM